MSKFKKYFRQIFCIAGFLLIALVFALNPVSSANASALTSQSLNAAVSSVHLPITMVDLSDEDETNNKLVIPLLNFKSTSPVYTIRVTDPSGRTHDLAVTDDSAAADGYFGASQEANGVKTVSVDSSNLTNGNYSITYIYKNGVKTYYSYPYAVEVKGVNYELSFVEPETDVQGSENKLAGRKILVPERAGDNTKIVLPDAYVKIAGTDNYEQDGQDHKVLADFTVEKDGAQIYSSKEDNECPEISQIADSNNDYNGKWQLTTSLGEEESVIYRVIYRYPEGDTIPNKTFEIKVTKDYAKSDAPKKLTVNAADLPSMQLGQKGIVLPEWTASSENIANVDTNITKIHIEKEGNSSIYLDLVNNNRTFDFTKENFNAQSYKDMVGNYTITYELESGYKDADGNYLTASLKKTALSVTDTSNPTVHMAYSYEIEGGEWEITENSDGTVSQVLKSNEGQTAHVKTKEDKNGNEVADVNTDYAVELKANYGFGELVFPAIYAEDLVNSYGELEFYRFFVNDNGDLNDKYYIDNIMLDPETGDFKPVPSSDKGYNASGDENIGKFNRIVRFKFNATSSNKIDNFIDKNYSLHYYVRVKDSANFLSTAQESNVYETGRTNYKFKVLNRVALGQNEVGSSSDVEGVSEDLSIKIKDLVNNSSINKNDKLSIRVESKDELDKRLKNAVFYYTGNANSAVKTDIETALNALLLDKTWGAYKNDGTPDTDDLTNTDYFTNLNSNILYNNDETNGLIKQMLDKNYTGFARLDEVDNDNFETQLDLAASVDKINIVAVTINDNNNIAVATKTLKVNKTDETAAPLAAEPSGHADLKPSYNQGEPVDLPKLTFSDTDDSSLTVSVKYYVLTEEDDALITAGENPLPVVEYKSVKNAKYTQTGTQMEISGAKIVTSKVGTYYVIFTAIDDAGNQTFVTYDFAVVDSSDPILTVTPKGEDVETNGTSIKAETNSVITFEPTVTKGGEDYTDSQDVTYEIEAVGKKYEHSATPAGADYALLFEEADEYVVTITAKYSGKELEKIVYYVTISEPELTWDFDIEKTLKADAGEIVELPNLTASFGKSKLPVPVTVTVTDRDNKTPEWGDVVKGENGHWTFRTNGSYTEGEDNHEGDPTRTQTGKYKVTYTATWKGVTITKTLEISVGDDQGPDFRFDNDVSVLEQDIVYTGADIEYTIDLTRYRNSDKQKGLIIRAYSDNKEIFVIDTGMSIWDKDGSGSASSEMTDWSRVKVELKTTDGEFNEVTDTDFEKQYNITKVGKYTLVLTTTDSNSNQGTKEFSFNVVAKTEPKKTNDNVVGIVLIVISVLVLVGVILFFALTGKKSGGNKTRKTKKTTDTAKVEAETATETDTDAKSGDVE